jgi:hypothetical protein
VAIMPDKENPTTPARLQAAQQRKLETHAYGPHVSVTTEESSKCQVKNDFTPLPLHCGAWVKTIPAITQSVHDAILAPKLVTKTSCSYFSQATPATTDDTETPPVTSVTCSQRSLLDIRQRFQSARTRMATSHNRCISRPPTTPM